MFFFQQITRKIHLYGNALGSSGGVALAEALGKGATPQLQALGLDDNKLGKQGAVQLAAALRKGAMPNLNQLYVERTRLGAAGRRLLDEAAGDTVEVVHGDDDRMRSAFCLVS